MVKLSREEFYKEFVVPFLKNETILEDYPFDFYWSGTEAEKLGYVLNSNVNGNCYYNSNKSKRTIVIKYRSNQLDTLRTFIHEIAHLIMHTKAIGICSEIKEIEAESVAKEIFNKLELSYKRTYIKWQQEKLMKKNKVLIILLLILEKKCLI